MHQIENKIPPRSLPGSDSSVLCLTIWAPLFAHEEPSEHTNHLSREIEMVPTKIKSYIVRDRMYRIIHRLEAALAVFITWQDWNPYTRPSSFVLDDSILKPVDFKNNWFPRSFLE